MGALGPEQIGPPNAATYRPRKVLVLITEDWFALSHFVPLLTEVAALAGEVVVATRPSGRLHEIASLGVRTRAFDMQRGVLQISALRHVRDGLASIIDDERPDVLHAISMQAMVMTSLALSKARHRPATVILHVTGLGYLGSSRSPVAHVLRPFALAALRRCTSTCNAWLVAENDDDVSRMVADRVAVPWRTAVVPGAGVDPARFPELDPPRNAIPCAAFVGRMLWSKGAETLVKAYRQVRAAGVALDLALYGSADPHTRQAVPIGTLQSWGKEPGITWHGRTEDVVGVWRVADIAVTPTLGGEGMPRAMLEAGACARPLIVTDVAGCRQFVRHGVEGFVVAPGEPEALARELARLAGDPQLRARMGAAARQRVLQDYSELAVRTKFREIYRDACGPARPPSTVSGRGAARPLRLGMKVSTKA
jgi:glycosyltransferase involved in cell wall biosynthesis